MEYGAKADAPCPVNLTNHAYFNLDGAPTDVRAHTLQIRAHRYLPIDDGLIPLGVLAEVAGSSFDFTQAKTIARDFLTDAQQRIAAGYDHAYLLDDDCRDCAKPAATLVSGDGTLAMELYTSKPALQFYSATISRGFRRVEASTRPTRGLRSRRSICPTAPIIPSGRKAIAGCSRDRRVPTTVLAFAPRDRDAAARGSVTRV